MAPEPIVKGDGAKKNDCERNAAKRLLSDVRREHPHLKLVVEEDGLASNGPHIKHLKMPPPGTERVVILWFLPTNSAEDPNTYTPSPL